MEISRLRNGARVHLKEELREVWEKNLVKKCGLFLMLLSNLKVAKVLKSLEPVGLFRKPNERIWVSMTRIADSK